MDVYKDSLKLHAEKKGKLEVRSKVALRNKLDLSLAYTPGVAEPCRAIAANPKTVYDYTIKGNCVAVVSDGSAVLGLGNIGAEAALPVMEGKCVLFKEFAGVDAFPICVKTPEPAEIIDIVKKISPVFGGINLEDIAAPNCFEVEQGLSDLGIPVFHDDQHGTATIVLAALINAAKVVGKDLGDLKVVVNGAGAAGIAVSKFLLRAGVGNLVLCDSKGVLSRERKDLNEYKKEMVTLTNKQNLSGGLTEAIAGRDVFIGVSVANVVSKEMVASMADQPIVFAMANPVPEIMPDEAFAAGAAAVGTGRSDFPNQINNVFAFPGIFRGALDCRAARITDEMTEAAAHAIAARVPKPTKEKFVPDPFDRQMVKDVAEAVKKAARESGFAGAV